MGPYIGYFKEARHAITEQRVDRQRDGESGQRHKPPTPPNRRQDGKGHTRWRGTYVSGRTNGAHEKPVATRSEIGKVDRALFRWRAPVGISAFEFVLVVQNVTGRKAQAHKIDLYLILAGGHLGQRHLSFAECRDAL